MSKELLIDDFRFTRFSKPALTASGVDGPWVKADTSAAGSPTVQTNGKFMELALTNTNEAQNLCLYMGDVLPYDIDDLVQLDIWAKLSAALAAAVSVALGLASARNDDPDVIAEQALFRIIGNNNLLVESDDGTNNNDDVATGLTLSTTVRRLSISFKEGINTVAGGLSTGGKSNVIFSAENGQGNLRRVAETTRFNLEAYAGGFQPYFQIQKTADAATGTLSIERVRVVYRGHG